MRRAILTSLVSISYLHPEAADTFALKDGHSEELTMVVLAQMSGGEFFFLLFVIMGIGILVHRFQTRCKNPKCGKWAREKRGAPCIRNTTVVKTDEWVMENTQTVVREDDRLGPTPWGDSRRQVRESYHEKVKYEVETTTTNSYIPCYCQLCGFKWEFDLPPKVNTTRKRVG